MADYLACAHISRTALGRSATDNPSVENRKERAEFCAEIMGGSSYRG